MPHLERITYRPPSVWARVAQAIRSTLSLKDPELARKLGWSTGPTAAGITVSEATALNYAAVWQAVTLIAGDIGSLPVFLYKRDDKGSKTRYPDHPLYEILHTSPNPEMSSVTFRETLQAHALTWGNGYAEIERDGGARPIALWPLLPPQVEPFRDSTGRLKYRVWSPGQNDVILDASNMLHLHGLGFDGLVGYSPISQARESLGLTAASERFGAAFFGNGSTFGGTLVHPKSLGAEGIKNLRDSIAQYGRGADKAHRFLVLEEGIQYTKFGVDPDAAQFLETRRFQIAEIARWFNLPLHKLREMTDSSVRANIEQEALDYYVATLRPWLVRWEMELNRKLVSPRERRIQHIEFNLDGVLRGDMKSRYDSYAVARQWGWLNVDEIRAFENMSPLPNGEGTKYLSPMNMVPADRLDEVIDKQVEPDPTPTAPAPADQTPPTDPPATQRDAWLAKIEAQAIALGELQARCAHLEIDANASHEAAEMARAAAEARAVAAEDAAAAARAQAAEAEAAATQARADVAAASEARDLADLDRQKAQALVEARDATLAATEQALTEARATAAAAAAALEAAGAETEAERSALTAVRASLEIERDAALAEVARLADVQTEAARQADVAHAALARADEASAAATAAAAQAQAATEASAALLVSVSTAVRAVVEQSVARLIRREAENLRRKAATPEKLRAGVQAFYEAHEADTWADALRPVVALHLSLVRSAQDADTVTRDLVAAHFELSKRQILAAAESDQFSEAVAGTLTRWERQRAADVADSFVRQEMTHVRTIQ